LMDVGEIVERACDIAMFHPHSFSCIARERLINGSTSLVRAFDGVDRLNPLRGPFPPISSASCEVLWTL